MQTRAVTIAAWLPVGVCAAFLALRTLGLAPGYPIYPLLAFVPYAIPAAIAAAAWALLLRRRGAATAGVAAALVGVAIVAPRVFGGGQPAVAAGAGELRVMSVNLAIGGADAAELARLALAQDVDVVSLQELTPAAARRLRAGPLGEELPHERFFPRPGGFGSGLMARRPLRPRTVAGFGHGGETAIATIRAPGPAGGTRAEIWSVHPPPPTSGRNVDDLRAYIDAIPPPDPRGAPRILAGDFNSSLDHPELRALTRRGFHDAAASLGAGLAPTWPSDSFPPKVTIDHVLGDGRIRFSNFSTEEIGGTDHYALLVTASVEAAGG